MRVEGESARLHNIRLGFLERARKDSAGDEIKDALVVSFGFLDRESGKAAGGFDLLVTAKAGTNVTFTSCSVSACVDPSVKKTSFVGWSR